MLDFEQYIDIFLDESKEHLQNLNQCLLTFENNKENFETINEIFRIAHTIKGMSATMGFETIASLTHKMENILDGIRSHKLRADQAIVDILFEGLDILEEQIKSIESSGKEKIIDISDIISRLEIMEKPKKPEDLKRKEETEFNEEIGNKDNQDLDEGGETTKINLNISREDMETIRSVSAQMQNDGYKIYKILVSLEPNCMLKAARAFLVFKTLESNGEIVYSDPSSDDIEDEKFDLEFTLLYSTKLAEKDVKNLIKDISEVKDVITELFSLENIHHAEGLSDDATEQHAAQEENIVNDISLKPDSKNTAEASQDTSAKKNKTGKTVRVDIDRLDNLMNLVSELIIVKTRLEDDEISSDAQNMTEAVEYLERITTNLHDAVTKVRMVPVERVFNRFPRMVRDLSRELNKEIELFMSGEETEVDRTVIDEIGDPLIHLIRNSLDHGIEIPQERIKKGKPEKGTVSLIAYPDGNTVVIEVSDDGAGINIQRVKEKAIDKGVITAEQARDMEDKNIAELIFDAGFSTTDKISDISGRGVGLDVVKTKIEALGGNVEIETELNTGSSFIIRLPLTLAIIQALLVVIGDEKYAIPLNNIKEITDIDTKNIRFIEKKEIVLYRDKPLALVRLSAVLDCEIQNELGEEMTVVIVKKGDKELGLIIDSLIGQQEIVIKSLGKYLNFVKEIAGATILGNGGVALILDTNSLF